MQFYAHKTIVAGSLMILGADFIGVASAVFGSVLPDVIDKKMSLGIKQLYHGIHRKLFHWWVLYVLGAIFCRYWLEDGIGFYIGYYLCVGAIIHILCDSLTKSGVPFIDPSKSGHGLKVLRTGSLIEYVIGTCIIAGGIYVRFIR